MENIHSLVLTNRVPLATNIHLELILNIQCFLGS